MSRILLTAILISANFTINVKAQNKVISITGPICVLAGGSNGVNYSISGVEQGDDNITWQISGGVIVGKNISSASGLFSALGRDIRVIWNKNSKSGAIKVTSRNSGFATLQVSVITILNKIDSSSHSVKKNNSLNISGDGPDNVCATSYSFWWEFSDSLQGPFIQIDGSNTRDLVKDSIKIGGYYRRVLSVNGDNIYSNIIYVEVKESKTALIMSKVGNPWALLFTRNSNLKNTFLYCHYHA